MAVLRVHIPEAVDAASLVLISGHYGREVAVRSQRGESGVSEYPIDFHSPEVGDASAVKLLLFCPGYRTVTARFAAEEATPSRVVAPRFEPLPEVRMELRVVDLAGLPAARESMSVVYLLTEAAEYLGRSEGMAFPLPIAEVTTDVDGRAVVAMPALLEDPFFLRYRQTAANLVVLCGEHRDVVPSRLPLRAAYPQPVLLTRRVYGRISGQIEKRFFRRSGLPGPISRRRGLFHRGAPLIELRAGGWPCELREDGTFSQALPPGSYDLELWITGADGEPHPVVPVEKSVLVGENETVFLTIR